MSIQTEIDRINTSVAAAYAVLEGMGATMPATQNIDNLAATAATIPTRGGGGGYVAQPEAPSDTSVLWIDTDDESCGTNGVQIVKLWENASPTSSFANGTVITIDGMDKYDLFGIRARFSGNSVATNIFWGRIDTRVEGLFSSTGQKIAVRMFDISNAGVTCNAGYYEGSASASHVLPLEIIGIKGVRI